MKFTDAIKIIRTAESAELGTFGAGGYPEIRALLNLPNEKKYPSLKELSLKAEGETVTLYFTTNTSSRKVAQVRENSKVCLYFCIPESFKGVSVTGTMEEVTDMDIKEAFWQPEWRMYYPKGSADPDYTLLRFTSRHLHCWGNFGLHDFGVPLED